MIDKVFIHIGLPKTGSTSIQKYLGQSVKYLKNKGYLFPLFEYDNVIFDNHSVPFRILFSKNNNTRFYQIDECVSDDKRNDIKKVFRNQLLQQIKSFNGDQLIFSGEGINGLTLEELSYLKIDLEDLIGNKVTFKIIVFVRNHIDRIPSNIQTRVKMGFTYKDAYDSILSKSENYFNSILTKFIISFGMENIIVKVFEDEVKEKDGIIGCFLGILKIDTRNAELNEEIKLNSSLSYESVIILSKINETIPLYINHSINPKRLELFQKIDFSKIPGPKFFLHHQDYKKIIQITKMDIDWLKKTFQIESGKLMGNYFSIDKRVWSKETMAYLYIAISNIEFRIKVIVLKAVLCDIQSISFKQNANTYIGVLIKLIQFYLIEIFRGR